MSPYPTVADLAADETLASLLDAVGTARADAADLKVFRLDHAIGDHLTIVGVYPADLAMFIQVWAAPTARHDLARTLCDIAVTSPRISVNDAVAFCIANQHVDPPRPTAVVIAEWDGVADHGWVYHAAGITPREYEDACPDLHPVLAFLALRGVAVPPIRTAPWPLSDPPHTM